MPLRLRLATSKAVNTPSNWLFKGINPARANPDLKRGFSDVLRLMGSPELRGELTLEIPPSSSSNLGWSSKKKPWVAMWRIIGLLNSLIAVSVASIPVNRVGLFKIVAMAWASLSVPSKGIQHVSSFNSNKSTERVELLGLAWVISWEDTSLLGLAWAISWGDAS